jgi:hypothetical protein
VLHVFEQCCRNVLQCIGCSHLFVANSGRHSGEFFSGRISQFDEQTKARTTFATIAGNPGLSGIAYNATSNRLYVSALNQGGVYTLDAQTGANLGFSLLGIGPGGLTVAPNGNVYVTDFTSNNVRIYDSSLTNLLGTVNIPLATRTSGVGFAGNGDLLVATPGTGVYRFDGNSVTSFTTSPAAPAASAQIAVDSSNNVFIGHGLGFSDNVLKFDASGNLVGSIAITDAMLGGDGTGSSTGTSPSGVAFDGAGNLFVTALGRRNPGEAGGEVGGLFKFDSNGNLLDTFATASNAFSGVVVITAVPEPSSMALLAVAGTIAGVAVRRCHSRRRRMT